MSEEQNALLDKAGESIEAAKLLYDNSMYDFAVSRAYYTMFYVTEAILLIDNLTFSKHSGVISAFGQHFAKTERVPLYFHRYLIEAQAKRTTGDYDIHTHLSQEETKEQLDRALEFIELGKEMISENNSINE